MKPFLILQSQKDGNMTSPTVVHKVFDAGAGVEEEGCRVRFAHQGNESRAAGKSGEVPSRARCVRVCASCSVLPERIVVVL